MKQLKLKLENCYGIKKLNHIFSFEESNISVVYAPNGTMKTSFASTFMDLSEDRLPCDRIFGLPTICDVKDENDNPISKESILVIDPFVQSLTQEQGKLMVDRKLQQEYMALHKGLAEAKDNLFNKAKQDLNYNSRSKFNPEQSISEDFGKPTKEIYSTLKLIKDKIESKTVNNFTISDINHSVLFDAKSLAFYKKDSNFELIKQYNEKYNELLEKSSFLYKGIFDHRNFTNVAKNLKENGFFQAEHEVIIKSKDGCEDFSTISSEEQLNKLLEAEKEKILNDAEIKRIFNKISSEINANKETKELDAYLQSKPELIGELENVEEFKRKIWVEVFRINIGQLNNLIELYDSTHNELMKISQKAISQETKWGEVLTVFKNRFYVPFLIEPDNQEDVILQDKMPVFNYQFSPNDRIKKQVQQNTLLSVLSTGEKRAYYLLDLIYKVKIRLLENKPTLLILDDIADSFDYKNKYAIIEYINDIMNEIGKDGNKLFTIIVLTHNFDFYRTVGSRLAKSKNCFITAETEDEIELTANQYLKDYFQYIRTRCLANSQSFVIAAIPFVRNLIEYTYSKHDDEFSDYDKLTNLLHIKNATYNMRISELQTIYNKYWLNNKATFANGKNDKIVDIIFSNADIISSNPSLYNKVNVENKIVLSIAIRLKAEEIMIEQIKYYVLNGEEIISSIQEKYNQTGELFAEYKLHIPAFQVDCSKYLEQVVMMTPENIHINSFMYEPILDMQGIHLVNLYLALKSIGIPS